MCLRFLESNPEVKLDDVLKACMYRVDSMSVGGNLSGQWVKREYRRESSTRSQVCMSSF